MLISLTIFMLQSCTCIAIRIVPWITIFSKVKHIIYKIVEKQKTQGKRLWYTIRNVFPSVATLTFVGSLVKEPAEEMQTARLQVAVYIFSKQVFKRFLKMWKNLYIIIVFFDNGIFFLVNWRNSRKFLSWKEIFTISTR